MKAYTVEVKKSDAGELYVELPDELLEKLGWKKDDVLVCSKAKAGNIKISKQGIGEEKAND